MRKEHGIKSSVVFADLVKAFDSIRHELIFELLKMFGIPEIPLKVIQELYKDFKIEVKIGKSKNYLIIQLE